jgi:hypothetical protein
MAGTNAPVSEIGPIGVKGAFAKMSQQFHPVLGYRLKRERHPELPR